MYKKIFLSSLLTVFLALIAAVTLIMGILSGFFEKQLEEELASEARILSHAVGNEGMGFFDSFDSKTHRVTFLDGEGNVLYDSRADISAMGNHADRAEIRAAMEQGTGVAVRNSETVMEKTVYYALRLPDGRILRVSRNQSTVLYILIGLIQPFLCIIVAALALTMFLSSRVSKAILKPVNALDLDVPENNDTYEELTPLLRKIARQKQTIEGQLSDARKKQEEFNLITENMSDGFLTIDQDANILTYNTAALKLLRIDPPADGNVLTFCRTKEFRDAISEVLSGVRAECVMVQDEHSYSLIATPVFEGGRALGAVVVILDITERERRETLRREFTANVSHELKTPLTSISGFAELLKKGDVPTGLAVEFAECIYGEAQRLISLVNDIIRMSELDGDSIPYEKEPVDIYRMSEEIIGRLGQEAEKKKVTFHLTGEATSVMGAPKILDEMIYNLFDNAIKYNKEGGTVDVIINQTLESVSFIVRDTGIGIPAAHQDRVFERFYRVDKSHSKSVGGTGLGLAIVKHGALCHNGVVSLKSAEGKGTEIRIRFPRGAGG